LAALFLLFGRSCFLTNTRTRLMRRKILVVEDNPDQLELVRLILEKEGFAIGTAANGSEALIKTRSISPDLIILDLMLPGLNGFDICETLRKDPLTASVPIVMLTGLCSQFGRLAGLESGANEFLTKPFNPEELVSKVDKLLRGQTSSKARSKSEPELNSSRHKQEGSHHKQAARPQLVEL
jgi:DNA-binding response OmpR family regulator